MWLCAASCGTAYRFSKCAGSQISIHGTCSGGRPLAGRAHAGSAWSSASKAENELVTAQRNLRNAERTRDLAVKDGARAGERLLTAEAASAEAEAVLASAEESLKALEAEAPTAGAGAVRALTFSPDGRTLAVSAEKTGLRLWSTETGKPLDVLQQAATSTLAYGSKGRLLAALPDKKILVWEQTSARWTLARQIGDHAKPEPFPDRVISLAFHPRGHLLAAGSGMPSRDGALSFWRVSDGKSQGAIPKAHLDTITGLAFSPDGHRIASSSSDRYIKIHQVESLELVDQLEGHTSHVMDVAWSADGETLASAGADKVAKLWTVAGSKQKKTESGFKKELTTVGEGIQTSWGGRRIGHALILMEIPGGLDLIGPDLTLSGDGTGEASRMARMIGDLDVLDDHRGVVTALQDHPRERAIIVPQRLNQLRPKDGFGPGQPKDSSP